VPAPSARHVVVLALYAVVTCALVSTLVLPRESLARHAWAFFHLAALSPMERFGLFALMLAGAHVLRPRRVNRFYELAASGRRFPRWISVSAAALGFLPLFWIFRDTNFELGDSALLIRAITRDVHLRGFHLTFDEPLELYLHSIAYAGLHRLAGWDVARTYALVSSLAGVFAIPVLIAFCSRIARRQSERLIALGLFMTSGFFALFFGHVENYTVVLLGLLAYLLVAHRTLRGEVGLFWPAVTLSISLCLHALAGFFLPSLLWLWWEQRAQPRNRTRELLMAGLGVVLPVAATLALCAWIGFGPDRLWNTHAAQLKFIVLLDSDYSDLQYRFLSPGHIVAVANELVLTALPGLLAITAALWEHKRSGHHDRLLDAQGRFLVAFAACAQFLALTWHPDLGPYRDWDLFAVVGLGYATLGAYLLVRVSAARAHDVPPAHSIAVQAGLPILVACGFLNSAWIVHNATRQIPVIDHHDAVHQMLGRS
jgi:hypothetical protein